MTSEFKIKKGVRQGCVLSPNLCNLYTENIFREVEDMNRVNIGGVNINNLRYADDTVLLAKGPMFLQALLTVMSRIWKAPRVGEEHEEKSNSTSRKGCELAEQSKGSL